MRRKAWKLLKFKAFGAVSRSLQTIASHRKSQQALRTISDLIRYSTPIKTSFGCAFGLSAISMAAA
jgi:hypothetical protein